MPSLNRLNLQQLLAVVLLCVLAPMPLRAQVLAQRNWAGSGVSVEPWWLRGVFYRVDIKRFQDSKADGRGDIAGVAQRLGYLQGLGVDALILHAEMPTHAAMPTRTGAGTVSGAEVSDVNALMDGFDDLARAAVDRHIRVLVDLGAPASQSADAQYLGLARAWLNQGAAGLYVPTAALEKVDGTEHIALLLRQLRALTDSFPGQRILVAGAPALQDQQLIQSLAQNTQLTASTPMDVPAGTATNAAAAMLRTELMAAEGSPSDAVKNRPLLQAPGMIAGPDTQEKRGRQRAFALMLLASRGAVLLQYGQELGLDAAANGSAPLMQWTPTNLTRKPPPPVTVVATKPSVQPPSMAFHAYIPPLRRDLFPPPPMPYVIESDDPVPTVVPPNEMPGFTAGEIDAGMAATNGAVANVALEQQDAGSLLRMYEQLIELHHENATLRNGTQTVLNYDAQGALVWVRRAPPNSRTSSNVIVGCNLSDKPVALDDVDGVRMRGMQSLLTPRPEGDLGMMAAYADVVAAVR